MKKIYIAFGTLICITTVFAQQARVTCGGPEGPVCTPEENLRICQGSLDRSQKMTSCADLIGQIQKIILLMREKFISEQMKNLDNELGKDCKTLTYIMDESFIASDKNKQNEI